MKKVTIDNLLTHTSGVRHYDPEHYFEEKQYSQAIRSRSEALKVNGAVFSKLKFTPGTDHLYPTYGINLVQDFIENISGRTYPQWLDENIVKSSKLQH